MTFTNLIIPRIERIFHLADTNENLSETSGVSIKKSSYDKARIKNVCEPVYDQKLMKARELQFVVERGWELAFKYLHVGHPQKWFNISWIIKYIHYILRRGNHSFKSLRELSFCHIIAKSPPLWDHVQNLAEIEAIQYTRTERRISNQANLTIQTIFAKNTAQSVTDTDAFLCINL